MLTRSSLFALLSLLLIADPLLAQRRAPPSKGRGSEKGRDDVDEDRRRRRRAPPSEGKGWKKRKPPIVEGFSPASGAPNTRVVIRGRRFGPMVKVRFNGRNLGIVARSRHEMTVVIPRRAVSDHFVVIKPGFPAVTTGQRFEVVRPPRIKRFRPPRGEVGITIKIKGRNFLTSDQVLLNGRPMQVQTVDPRRIIATVPNGATSGRIAIRRGSQIVAQSAGIFVVALPPPVITNFSPARGEAGTVVRITGRNFDPTDTIRLAGRPLPIRGRGPAFIEVVVRGRSGPFILIGRAGRRAVSPSPFTLIRPPVVRGFRPRFGPPGTQITIFGRGFLPGDNVYLGPAMLTVRTVSDVQIVAELPAGVSNNRIYVKRGSRAFYARGAFRVIHAPAISSITPNSGPPGTIVTIRGSHLMPGMSAMLSGRRLQIITRRFPNEIRARIPNGARSGRMVVVTRGGTATSRASFVVNEYGTLHSFFPVRGLPGTRVTLKGRGFHPGMKVWLHTREVNASQVSRVTPTSAVLVVPEGYPSGRITIETFGRKSRSRMLFTVETPRPEVEFTFAPRVARRGTDVTLTLIPPRQGVTVYFNNRPLPKRVLLGGRRLVVTVPGDARRTGYFEIEYKGRRYRAARPLRVR